MPRHVLLYGDMPHAVTLRAMLECDMLLRTTLYDGDSVSVREALYIGTPVIATDNGMRPPGVHLIPRIGPGAIARCGGEPSCDAGVARQAPAGDGQENVRAVLRFYEELLGGSTRNGSAYRRALKVSPRFAEYCHLVVVLKIAAARTGSCVESRECRVVWGATWRPAFRFAE